MTISTSRFSSDATFVASSFPPTISAPAFSASDNCSPPAKTATFTSFPVPLGRETVVLKFCSASSGSIPNEKTISTDSSNLAVEISLQRLSESSLEIFVSDTHSFA